MTFIKKIIDWIKKIFYKLFKRRKKNIKRVNNSINQSVRKRYLKGYGVFIEESAFFALAPYLIINKNKKDELIKKIIKIEKILEDNYVDEEIVILENLITVIKNEPISIMSLSIINEEIENILNIKK